VAAKEPEVLLVSLAHCCPADAWPEAEARVLKELLLSNLHVVQADGMPDEAGRYGNVLKGLAEERGAAAGVTLSASSDESGVGLTVYTVDPKGHGTLQEIEVALPRNEETAEIVAIRAVEAVRAGLEISPVERAEREAVAPGETKADGEGAEEDEGPSEDGVTTSGPPPPAFARFRITARFLIEGGPGGVGMLGAVGLGFRGFLLRQLSLGFNTTLSVVGRDVTSDRKDATASFDMVLTRLNIAWEAPLGAVLRPAVGASVGAAYIWSKGSTETTDNAEEETTLLEGRTEGKTAFYAGAFGELSLAVSKRIWIPIRVAVGVIPPGVEVRFGTDLRAEFGLPLLEASLGLALNLG
jgi:hypothetical protein